jgi:hypothetical protein
MWTMPAKKKGPKEPRQNPVDLLVVLLEQLDPFLDRFDINYCRLPHADPEKRAILPLKDFRVRDLVFYRYYEAHQSRPTWKQIAQALAQVRGKLLATWNGSAFIQDCPVLRVMLKAAERMESWVGTAADLLVMLTALDRELSILNEGEKLPYNEDAMGIWLRDNNRRLSARGMKVYRPRRKARERLWAWLTVTASDDTHDTLPTEVSPQTMQPNQMEANNNRQNDAHVGYSEEEQLLLNIINKGGIS